jgi:hypothetical protein
VFASKEIRSLTETSTVLQRVREMPDGRKQTLVYVRQP